MYDSKKEYKDYPIFKKINITSMISSFRYRYRSDYKYEGESHDFWEFACILDGDVSIAIDEKVFELHKGQIIFINPLEFHNLCSANNTDPEVLIMSFKLSGDFRFDKRIVTISDDIMNEFLDILRYGRKIFNFRGICVESAKEGKELETQIFANRLEILLLEIMKEEITEEKQLNTRSAVNYSKIMKILKANIGRKESICC